jgi:benzoyl-CoA reductase/2-hydroxyglutaryl-CoA dehydratase subunit BcrC/BadD/HgdB
MNEKTVIDKYFQESARDSDGAGKIGWFCTYAPEELILAGGFEPVRLMGEKELKTSESYFPINFCPYLKSGWESLLKYGDKLSAAVFTNSCDGMRRFYDIAEHYLKDVPIFMLDVPRNTYPDSINFYSLQLKKMLGFIEKLKGSDIDDKDLLDAIHLCDRKRAGLKEISRAFLSGDGFLSIPDYYQLMELSATAGSEKFLKDLDTFTERSGQGENKGNNNSPKIMIVGNFITEDKLWDMFQELDMSIAADDLCISNRYYEGSVEAEGSSSRKEMLELLAKRYLGKPACMRMADTGQKLEEIMAKVQDNGVQGVIFISLKFCDTMLYSFPLIRKELAKLGIPVLYLEIEYNNFSEGQIKTRMQAFLEML